MLKRFLCLIIIVVIAISLISCSSGSYEDVLAVRSEFSQYVGKNNVAMDSDEYVCFDKYRFRVSFDGPTQLSMFFLYNSCVYYAKRFYSRIDSKEEWRIVLYRCNNVGENTEEIFDTGWLTCRRMTGDFVYYADGIPVFYYSYRVNRVTHHRLYNCITGEIIENGAEEYEYRYFWHEISDEYEVEVDKESMMLTVTDIKTKEVRSKSLYDMTGEYQASLDKFGFYFKHTRQCGGRFFLQYDTDIHYANVEEDVYIYPTVIFELNVETMELEYAGYFEPWDWEGIFLITDSSPATN